VLGAHLRDRDLRPERLHLAALAESHALLARHPAEVDHGLDEPGRSVHLGAGELGELSDVAAAIGPPGRPDMVAVAVRHQDQSTLPSLARSLWSAGRLGIPLQPRIGHDHLAARRGDLERRLTEPVHLDLPGLRREQRGRQPER
jgi:hypothetical protein